ncbi:MAG: hypothetical protein GEU80_06510 [Dehalococcoidia bacterium]|nr:hypothetical protein [Dehalococcoidia bacterium]
MVLRIASIVATTDQGLVRAVNEDAAYAALTPEGAVLAVADGMGGHPGGDIASAFAIAATEGLRTCEEVPEACLDRAWRAALTAVRDLAAQDASVATMGTTLTAALVRGGRAWLLHIGDSRGYLYRPGIGLRALTTDHSLAGEAVSSGALDADAARDDARRHVLTRAIGPRDAQPDILGPQELAAGDRLLLLTDGVTGVLSDGEIAAAVEGRSPRDAATELLLAVHVQGAPDNSGIAMLEVGA